MVIADPARLGDGGGSLLFVAHPGHELRVFGWVEAVRPTVCILTDGSGGGGASRLEESRALLLATGARIGPVFGRIPDRVLYDLLLAGEHGPLLGIATELAGLLFGGDFGRVAGDAAEGFNPGHDVARHLLDAAVRVAGGVRENLEFALEGAPSGLRAAGGRPFPLDDAAFERKLAAARGYRAMAAEIESALARHGEAAFRTEWLFPAGDGTGPAGGAEARPYYETFGEMRVREGRYAGVLRRREHLEPLVGALRRLEDGTGRCAS